jgi:hypothetical protein
MMQQTKRVHECLIYPAKQVVLQSMETMLESQRKSQACQAETLKYSARLGIKSLLVCSILIASVTCSTSLNSSYHGRALGD